MHTCAVSPCAVSIDATAAYFFPSSHFLNGYYTQLASMHTILIPLSTYYTKCVFYSLMDFLRGSMLSLSLGNLYICIWLPMLLPLLLLLSSSSLVVIVGRSLCCCYCFFAYVCYWWCIYSYAVAILIVATCAAKGNWRSVFFFFVIVCEL